jgi:hypothetical protein
MLEKEYPDNYLQEEAIMMLDKIEIPCTNNCNGIAFGSIHVETSSRTAIFTCSHSCHEPWPDQKKLFLRDGWKITNDPT